MIRKIELLITRVSLNMKNILAHENCSKHQKRLEMNQHYIHFPVHCQLRAVSSPDVRVVLTDIKRTKK